MLIIKNDFTVSDPEKVACVLSLTQITSAKLKKQLGHFSRTLVFAKMYATKQELQQEIHKIIRTEKNNQLFLKMTSTIVFSHK